MGPRHRPPSALTRRDLEAVRALLWRWDAIGVRPDGPRDEYDEMIWPIVKRLREGRSTAEIAEWVGAHVREHFELRPRPDADAELAAALQRWWMAGPGSAAR